MTQGAGKMALSDAGQKVEQIVAKGRISVRHMCEHVGGWPGPPGKSVCAQARGPLRAHTREQPAVLAPSTG